MTKIVVRISRAGVILREVEVHSKYDAKQRRQKLQFLHPDCTIEVVNASPQSSPTVDGTSASI